MAEQKLKPRIMPNSLEAEQSLLGSLFISVEAQLATFSKIKADDFYSNAHKKIYSAMEKLYRDDVAIDYVTVVSALEKNGNMNDVGGISYITELTNAVPSAANFKHYIEIIKNNSILRQLIEIGNKTVEGCFGDLTADEALAKTEKLIFDLSQKQQSSELRHIGDGLTEVISRMEKVTSNPNAFKGVRTGFKILDQYTNGFQKGDLILLAARPSVGKTTLAMNMCTGAAFLNASVAVFSLEMPIEQLAQRALCSTGFIKMNDVKLGTKQDEIWDSVFATQKKLNSTRLYIDDNSTTKPSDILSKCTRLKREVGLDLIMIDYLQLMTGDLKSGENRQNEVAQITRSLKIAARELGVPIILLSQLSRAIEKREDHSPQLSDLRESGAIEQDADIVMFISKYKDKNEQEEDISSVKQEDEEVKLIIAKHRNGELGTIKLKWAPSYNRFYDVDDKSIYSKLNKHSAVQNNEVMTPVVDKTIADAFDEDDE